MVRPPLYLLIPALVLGLACDATTDPMDSGGTGVGDAGGTDEAGPADGSTGGADGDVGATDTGEDAGDDGTTDTDAGDDDGNAAWRPFGPDSPWNTPIADDPALAPDSEALIQHLVGSSEWPFLSINIDRFSVPVYWIDASTEMKPVEVLSVAGEGFDEAPQAPIPDGATPDPESDRHMCIVDRESGKEWGFFGAQRVDGQWKCDVCATADLEGSGVRPPKDGNQDWWLSHGARACGFPLIAGLITTEEMEAGRIDHALVLAYPGIRSRYYTPPASTAQATFDAISQTEGLPCGARIQLDPSLDLDALGLSESGKIVARALQEYGAFIGDYSGSVSLYADGSPQAQEQWGGGLLDTYELREAIDLSWLRVLELGTLHDDMN